jgi:glycosyltransferase involved in cell wall biosynthesis
MRQYGNSTRVRDLLVTAFTPTLSTGQGLRTYGIVKALAESRPVDLLHATFGADEPAAEYEAIDNLEMIQVRPRRDGRRIMSYAQALADGVPDAFARGSSPELTRLAEQMASAQQRGRVVADGPVAAASLRNLARNRAVTYNAHNLESSFRHLIGSGSVRARRRLERFEVGLLQTYEEVWMASQADVAAARELVPAARARYVPNVVDTAKIRPRSAPSGQMALFIGDFTYAPNLQALDHLETAILPELWERLPSATVEVAGRGLDGRVSSDHRLSYLGFVADLDEAYARARCVVVPLLSGGGSPLKFVEALAYGSAIVATPAATRGIEGKAGRDFLEESSPTGFAIAMAAVLRGEQPHLRRNARQLAEREYSLESLRHYLCQ